MTKTFQILALALALAVLALTSAARAQDATTPPADAALANDLAMGVEANPGLPSQADAAVEGTYLAAMFDKWEQRCVKKADGSDPCQLYQLLLDKDAHAVAEISLFDLPPGNQAVAGATLMAPLETLLTANLKITVDTGAARLYPFAFCTKLGCVARIGFTAEELAAFKKGSKAVVTIVPAFNPQVSIDLDLPLTGFTAGYEAVAKANAP